MYYPPQKVTKWCGWRGVGGVGGVLLCHVIEISKSWSTLLYFSLTATTFAGVSLSSLIIKQHSPLLCRLKGFPNLINMGRNNNNKTSTMVTWPPVSSAERRTCLDVGVCTLVFRCVREWKMGIRKREGGHSQSFG